VVALDLAGGSARGATLYVTLEPCSHHGRTPPCVEAILAAGVRRVVVGVEDPDAKVAGRGIRRLREGGLDVTVGVLSGEVAESLAPYLFHRRTGRPWVVLKLAMTLDGRIAAPDGTSKWITSPAARADSHQLRAESDAVLVGAGTVRTDDPALTVRDAEGPDPLRVVLGKVDHTARVMPALQHEGDLEPLLDDLGARGVVQLLVEGGSSVAGAFHRCGLVNQYVLYYAPAILGGADGLSAFGGDGSPTMEAAWRGRITGLRKIGPDVRIDVLASWDGSAVP
jgi:diaminohydroxyphosphoribosylaminopyrimidine deaminase/5-amino-6-(5-phosphoribosylamino)uracil reductase